MRPRRTTVDFEEDLALALLLHRIMVRQLAGESVLRSLRLCLARPQLLCQRCEFVLQVG